ncbi:hypothetical protein [Bacillus cereus group sp. BfR-BA-01345]|uniref:hypothetical protein n=1 Tax=Bacillus cereus group sp. BfR-BA-01345 TaxID=2920308 RepID=UPI001F55B38E|nr:hypothetical protein [Bacillus cereus]
MDNQNYQMKTEIVELRIQVTGLQQTIEGLTRKVTMLEEELATKADITHVQLINKQSEIIKKINDSKSIPMDCKVGVSLNGRVVAESIVEHTADSIKCGVIKGSEINETR